MWYSWSKQKKLMPGMAASQKYKLFHTYGNVWAYVFFASWKLPGFGSHVAIALAATERHRTASYHRQWRRVQNIIRRTCHIRRAPTYPEKITHTHKRMQRGFEPTAVLWRCHSVCVFSECYVHRVGSRFNHATYAMHINCNRDTDINAEM